MRTRHVIGGTVVAALVLVGCSDAGDEEPSPSTTGQSETVEPTETMQPTETVAPPGTESPSPDPAALEDGRHPATITAVDLVGETVTVDVIQFLTGQEAIDAYHEEFPDDPDGPPNDYWILNENPRLRTLAVAAEVDVQLVKLAEDGDADLDPATFSELPDHIEFGVFWLTLEDGVVVAIEEQYIP